MAASDWRQIKDDREKYKAYLCSREWALLRNAVRARCGGKCERCGVNDMECVHHLTYARKYDERIEDLAGWCNACHEFTHGRSDVDPKPSPSVAELILAHGWCDGMTRAALLSFVDDVVAKGWRSYGEMYCYMNIAKEIENRMGRGWLLAAAAGAFAQADGSSDGVSYAGSNPRTAHRQSAWDLLHSAEIAGLAKDFIDDGVLGASWREDAIVVSVSGKVCASFLSRKEVVEHVRKALSEKAGRPVGFAVECEQ
jgi:hypothetical protein